jgi:dihydroneopterin aldolase
VTETTLRAAPGVILLQGMRFEGRHGASAEERAYPQPLEVDLEVDADLSAAAGSDALADTIDYGPLIDICRAVVEERSFHLLEAICGAIAEGVLAAAPKGTAVTVRVRKLAVPVDADLDFAQLQLRFERPPSGRSGSSAADG